MRIDEESDNEKERMNDLYKYNFVNVTVNIYDSAPMKFIDFELFFMLISMAIFWMFLGVIFYELWWYPNQLAQGNTPLPTQEWVAMIYREYVLTNYYVFREKVAQTPNPMAMNRRKSMNGMNGFGGKSNKESKKKSKNDGWLAGTSVANKKNKNKKKRN